MDRSELTTPPPLSAAASAAPIAQAPSQAIAPPPLPADKSAIATNALTKRYGSLTALDALSLRLDPGDVFGFIGPNGAGKSTTMKILAGLLSPTSGSATVLGKNVASNGEFIRRSVGYMPDSFGVYEDLKVCEYLEFFASAYGLPRNHRRKIVQDVLELTDLKYKQDAFVDSLSRGMQQRLGLARVLVHDPPVLLLDEPASGLDPRARIEIRELLKELQRLGKTIMISSHILSELGEFCNKLGIIERGKLIISGTIDELMAMARAHPVISIRLAPQAQHELERAVAVLKTDARVNQVEVIGSELQVTLTDKRVHHFFLMERLVAANIPLDSVAPHQMKLEDVFLRLTKGIVQ
ncbi:MAG TPA: ABC transporter ATP-binding protein [Tepidisphaeraceae bacterium]|nr:ABC transporter ATP-binding protein [Tepidisphaeraceae bacterium]